LKQGLNEFTSDVFFLFGQLRFKTEPEDGPSTVLVGRWFVDMDKDGFSSDINQVQRPLFLGVSVKWAVVDGARAVTHLEIPHPFGDVGVSRHDAVEVAFRKSGFVAHPSPLLSSPP
jgi:hypothetical protein